jgi:hypothetical protein
MNDDTIDTKELGEAWVIVMTWPSSRTTLHTTSFKNSTKMTQGGPQLQRNMIFVKSTERPESDQQCQGHENQINNAKAFEVLVKQKEAMSRMPKHVICQLHCCSALPVYHKLGKNVHA